MTIPKPDGYRGGDDGAAEWVGVTLGSRLGINVNSTDDDLFPRHRRNARSGDYLLEDCN
jgi:hypothetical protein